MIRFAQVSKRYPGEVQALSEATLQIPKGELVFLWGPSGAGKSTFLRLIAGAERASSGSLQVEGRELAKLRGPALAKLRRSMGLAFQDLYLLPQRSVTENVALPLLLRGLPRAQAHERARALIERLDLGAAAQKLPASLSGGERQRVAIARALIGEPSLVLADEPTAHLDPLRAAKVMALLGEAHARGATVLIATHDPTLIESHPSRRIHLEEGRVVAS